MQDIHNPKNTVTPLLTLDGENVNFNYYKHLGIVLDTDLSDDKGIGRQLRYQCCAVNKLRAFFPDIQMQFKTYLFFLLHVRVCIIILAVIRAEISCGL